MSAGGGEYANRQVLVTGAGSGIGAAVVRAFAGQGAAVLAVDISYERAAATADAAAADGGAVAPCQCDVTSASDCESAVRKACGAHGLDVLVNGAGIIRRADILETTEQEWDLVMATNVKSAFLLGRAAIPLMRDGGSIVSIASGWGLVGGRRAASYCASKGALVQLTRAMALDHGPAGIRVNCVCPGDINTPMLRDEARQLGQPAESLVQSGSARPLGRVGEPAEVAQAVLFLAGPRSSFIDGEALVIDGGAMAGTG